MNYLTIIDNQGGFWTETKEEAWDLIIGSTEKQGQIVDINRGRFTDILIGQGSESMKDYLLTEEELAKFL